jgi:hypothetical protein
MNGSSAGFASFALIVRDHGRPEGLHYSEFNTRAASPG